MTRLAQREVAAAHERLRPFADAGVLSAADVHGAQTLCRLVGEERPDVLLAAALAVRAPGTGHVCLDLATVADTATHDGDPTVDPGALPWPEDLAGWRAAVAGSALVTGTPAPLVLAGDRLYLERYHRYEQALLAWVRDHGGDPAAGGASADAAGIAPSAHHPPARPPGEPNLLHPEDEEACPPRRPAARRQRPAEGHAARAEAVLGRLFGDDADQCAAGRAVLRRRCTVITGGPGTGKTTTVARILGLLAETADTPPQVALAAPSGKAATRLQEAVRAEARDGPFAESVSAWLADLRAQTVHRLLGWRGGTRYAFGPDRQLAVDAVVLDEASMVSISLVVRLLQALPLGGRVVLVGDHEQLASVEAGAVLGDLVAAAAAGAPPLRDGVVTLTNVHRFGGGVALLAAAIRAGDADAALALLRAGGDGGDLELVDASAPDAPEDVRPLVAGAAARAATAAAGGDHAAALAALESVRVLAPHRRGPDGVEGWTRRIERWLAAARPGLRPWEPTYAGRPVMVTGNDYRLGLFNGDLGIVVTQEGRPQIAFPTASGSPRLVAPSRVGPLETVHAMTVHKAQGSQFGHTVVALPRHPTRLLTRELLYTAVTRAQHGVTLIATEASIRAAIARRLERVSGIREGLTTAGV